MARGKITAAKGKGQKAREPIVQNDGVNLADESPQEPVAGNAASNEEPKSATPQPNVIWSSEKKEDDSLKYGNPPASVRIGIGSIEVPDAKTQLKGFYSEHAARLVRNIPGYKYLKPKGDK